ncbi:MAG TPA: hypothetical protein VFH94_19015 [Streptomyces sp.]|nr:hypothetical protein [Streptomyces sp.]
MRFRHSGAVALGAFALLVAFPTSVNAASGGFFYTNTKGEEFENNDPDAGKCFPLVAGAAHAVNNTDGKATVYSDRSCGKDPDVMPPHSSKSFGNDAPRSVEFG